MLHTITARLARSAAATKQQLKEAFDQGATQMRQRMEEAYSKHHLGQVSAKYEDGSAREQAASARVRDMADELSKRQYKYVDLPLGADVRVVFPQWEGGMARLSLPMRCLWHRARASEAVNCLSI